MLNFNFLHIFFVKIGIGKSDTNANVLKGLRAAIDLKNEELLKNIS